MARALISGGGIAGLAAGLALRQAGYDVTIFERAAAIEPIGAALSMWPNALAALDRLGAADAIRAQAAPIATMLLADRAGRPIFGPHTMPVGQAFMVTRSLLQSALRDALGSVDLRLGQIVDDVTQDGESVTFTLGNGTAERGDAAIVADGIWSPTATALIGNPPQWRGYGGVVALSDPVPGLTTGSVATEYQGDSERFGVFGIGDRCAYWFYMRDTPSADSAHPSQAELADRAATWPDSVSAVIAATPADRLLPFSIHARAAPRRLGRARILCVGDAAHAMEPNLGQGACQALEDAVALGIAASDAALDAILPGYERLRLARVRAFVARSAQARHTAHGSVLKQRALRTILRDVPATIEHASLARMHRMPSY